MLTINQIKKSWLRENVFPCRFKSKKKIRIKFELCKDGEYRMVRVK